MRLKALDTSKPSYRDASGWSSWAGVNVAGQASCAFNCETAMIDRIMAQSSATRRAAEVPGLRRVSPWETGGTTAIPERGRTDMLNLLQLTGMWDVP